MCGMIQWWMAESWSVGLHCNASSCSLLEYQLQALNEYVIGSCLISYIEKLTQLSTIKQHTCIVHWWDDTRITLHNVISWILFIVCRRGVLRAHWPDLPVCRQHLHSLVSGTQPSYDSRTRALLGCQQRYRQQLYSAPPRKLQKCELISFSTLSLTKCFFGYIRWN